MKEYFMILDKLDTDEAIHDYFVRMLALPGHYGRNLDALYDVLTDISEDTVFAPVSEKEEEKLPGCTRNMLRVMFDAAKENGHIQIKR